MKVVARITSYSPTGDDPIPEINNNSPLWVFGDHAPNNINYDIINEQILVIPPDVKQALIEASTEDLNALEIALAKPDEWMIVPENEWPDEVCAAVAKHVLLGENEGESDEEQ